MPRRYGKYSTPPERRVIPLPRRPKHGPTGMPRYIPSYVPKPRRPNTVQEQYRRKEVE
jgi:hypothetical protein